MSGNVWEWCQDWYAADFYKTNTQTQDPCNTKPADCRVVRGGSWYYGPDDCRVAVRWDAPSDCRVAILITSSPNCGNSIYGFRFVQDY